MTILFGNIYYHIVSNRAFYERTGNEDICIVINLNDTYNKNMLKVYLRKYKNVNYLGVLYYYYLGTSITLSYIISFQL